MDHNSVQQQQNVVSDIQEEEEDTPRGSRHYIRDIVNLSLPIIVSEIFQNTLPIVDLAFVGRLLSKDDLAAAALATVWFNLWNATMLGFITALDTLLSQAYGAQQYTIFAAWTGNGLLIVQIMTCFVAILVALCEPAMNVMGQDHAVAAGQFSYRLVPGLFPYFAFKVLVKHLQTQDILLPGVVIGLMANVFNILANWALISELDWGLNGAPTATTLTRFMEFFAIAGYFYYHKNSLFLSHTWPSCHPKAFLLSSPQQREDTAVEGTGTGSSSMLSIFLRLAASGALSFTAEAWSFEITTILAGLLSTTALDAHIVTLSIATFLYLSFPFAIGIAASIKTGQLIGGGSVVDAQRSALASFSLTFLVQASLIILVWPSSQRLGELFSSDPEVANLVAELLPLSCVFMMGDSIHCITGGVMRGLGQQKLLFCLNVVGYWFLAVPVGSLLTFVANIGVKGLWWGMSVGIYSTGALGLLLLRYCINWQAETVAAKNRMSPAEVEQTVHVSSSTDVSELPK